MLNNAKGEIIKSQRILHEWGKNVICIRLWSVCKCECKCKQCDFRWSCVVNVVWCLCIINHKLKGKANYTIINHKL